MADNQYSTNIIAHPYSKERCERKVNKRRKRNWNRLEKKRVWSLDKHRTETEKGKDKGKKGRGGRKQYLFLVIAGVPQGEGNEVSWVKQGGTCSARLQWFNHKRRVTTKQSTWRQTRHSHSHTNTNSRSIPHTPRVCSQAMSEVTRDKEIRKSKRGRQLVPVEYTAQGKAHRTQVIYRSCKSNTNISPKHSYTQIACEDICIFWKSWLMRMMHLNYTLSKSGMSMKSQLVEYSFCTSNYTNWFSFVTLPAIENSGILDTCLHYKRKCCVLSSASK